MTTAAQLRASGLARGWRNFRRWRRGRPFWGGVFLILSAIELFWSSNQDLAGMQVHFGPQGFLSYVIPGLIGLCGLLTLLTPQQRLFYGIVGACTAVFSLIGLNLGGFFVGMLLGITGGALSAAWTRVSPDALPPAERLDDEPDGGYADSPVDDTSDSTVDDLMSGPLTDVLPGSMRSPLADPPAPLADPAAEPPQPPAPLSKPPPPPPAPPPPPPPLPRRDVRLLAITLVPLTLGVLLVASVRQPPALADQCPPAGGRTTHTSSAPVPPAPSGKPTTSDRPPSSTPTAAAAAEHTGNAIGNAIRGLVDAIASLFGGGRRNVADPAPAPSVQPSAPASRSPAAQPSGPKPTPVQSSPKACGPGSVRKLAVDPGQPPVNVNPSIMTAGLLTMSGLSFDGVVELPTAKGPLRTLRFSMNKSVSSPFELRVPTSSRTLSLTSSTLTVQGHVKFYASRFAGKLFGLFPMVFTPDSPPRVILPELLFTDANIQLVFVDSDTLIAPNLTIAYTT